MICLTNSSEGAAIMTLIQSAKLNGHDPYGYLKGVLTCQRYRPKLAELTHLMEVAGAPDPAVWARSEVQELTRCLPQPVTAVLLIHQILEKRVSFCRCWMA